MKEIVLSVLGLIIGGVIGYLINSHEKYMGFSPQDLIIYERILKTKENCPKDFYIVQYDMRTGQVTGNCLNDEVHNAPKRKRDV